MQAKPMVPGGNAGSGRSRFLRDFLDRIINPSKEINEQHVPIQVSMK